jgi:protoheme IX farnesyltransferase
MTAETAAPATFRDYLELTKPRLSLLSVITTLVGYFATRPPANPAKFTLLFIGTALAAGGVAALNQWLEHDTDAKMRRTADRPIPTGKVATGSAFVLGWLMCSLALFILFARVDRLAALFTLLTVISYLGCTRRRRSARGGARKSARSRAPFLRSSAGAPVRAG